MIIYTDGSCIKNGKDDAQCGAGIWVDDNHPINRAIRIPKSFGQSNQIGELAAVVVALQLIDNFVPCTFISDSQYVIKGLTEFISKWEDNGWIGINNSLLFRVAVALLRQRSAPTGFKWVKGHSGVIGNENSDERAGVGAARETEDPIDTEIPPNFDLQGAKLSTITQRIAYKGVRAQKQYTHTPGTETRVSMTQEALQAFNGELETKATIWKGCQNKDLRRNIQQFLYKALYNVQRVGDWWNNIPGYEHRSICPYCEEDNENMSHILTECTHNARETIWELAKSLWPYGDESWPTINLGIILASGCLSVPKTEEDKNDRPDSIGAIKRRGASRLLRILISESAHLIWVLRCERAIQGITHTKKQITTRWRRAINKRLTLDRVTASKIIKKPKAILKVIYTWTGTIKDENNIPQDWVSNPEVLVGIKPPPAPS
ncbi:ribonuclease H-like protein [Artomyces pyxidatus]|uniref:Ribonuclease H-like protein n=1 Tax=Artomyces pyxidatus TaxID=48021 RepID=A0ACB8SJN7_9AGAM|nr:ribonuclease H-like protein [Artomyces pyxidatus]